MSPETQMLHADAAHANRAFYGALEALDLERMRALWLDDPTAKCVHPGGEVIVGTHRIMASWRAIFTSSNRLRFELLEPQLEVVGEMAWVSNTELLHIELERGVVLSESAVTNLFVRRDDGWKMVLHHASPIARRFFDG